MERSHRRAARFNPRQEKVRFVAYTRLLGRTFRRCHEADPPPVSVRTRQPLSLSFFLSSTGHSRDILISRRSTTDHDCDLGRYSFRTWKIDSSVRIRFTIAPRGIQWNSIIRKFVCRDRASYPDGIPLILEWIYGFHIQKYRYARYLIISVYLLYIL